jgi:hypothetical protein
VREAQKQRVLDEVANGLDAPSGNGQKNHERDRERQRFMETNLLNQLSQNEGIKTPPSKADFRA